MPQLSCQAFNQPEDTQAGAKPSATHLEVDRKAFLPRVTVCLLLVVSLPLAGRCQTPVNSAQSDFPQHKRYADANLTILASHSRPKVIFLGDSIIDYWGSRAGTWFTHPGWINRGIGGQTTAQLLLRERSDVLQLHPKAVVLEGGSNDMRLGFSPEEIRDNFESMGELAQTNQIRVFVASMTPTCDCYTALTGLRTVERIRQLNALLKRMCDRNGWGWIDLNTPLANPDHAMRKELTFDGVHPNDKGYSLLAPVLEKSLAPFL
jgi:lysophospholipase L1-like esterase